jgi:chromate transporter
LAQLVDFNNPQSWLFGLIHGLKLLAVVVVCEAIQSMAKSFCKTKFAISIALTSALVLIMVSSAWTLILVILAAAAAGVLNKSSVSHIAPDTHSHQFIVWPLVIFAGLFVLSLVFKSNSTSIHAFASFFQSGSLVFGGGHVVLPLLQGNLGEALNNEQFLFGYAAAQGVPGPMFTIATFMGALLNPSSPLLGALIATVAIFLPGFLLVLSLQGVWQNLLGNKYFSGATWGINAGVVGLLIATLYHPILTSTLNSIFDLIFIVLGLFCVKVFKLHILCLIGLFSLIGIISSLI